jgi:WD40 repeat protein
MLKEPRTVVVWLESGPLLLWNVESDSVEPLTAEGDGATCVDVSADRSRLLVGTANGRCQVHDASTGEQLRTISHSSTVADALFVPAGQQVLTVDDSGVIRLWDNENARPVHIMRDATTGPQECRVAGDGSMLVAWLSQRTGDLCSWDLSTGTLLHRIAVENVMDVAMTNDGTQAVVASRSQGLLQWDLQTGALQKLNSDPATQVEVLGQNAYAIQLKAGFPLDTAVLSLPDEPPQTVLSGYSLASGETLAPPVKLFGDFASRLAVDVNEHRLAVASWVWSCAVCDPSDGTPPLMIGASSTNPVLGQFLNDSQRLVIVTGSGDVSVWSVSGEQLSTFSGAATPGCVAAAVSTDGQLVACGQRSGRITVSELQSGRELVALNVESPASVISLQFSNSGTRLLAAYTSGIVRRWDLISHEALQFETGRAGCAAYFSADDRYVLIHSAPAAATPAPIPEGAGTSSDSTAFLWDPDRDHSVPIPDSEAPVTGQFAADGRHFLLVNSDGSVNTYSVTDSGDVSTASKFAIAGESIRDAAWNPVKATLLCITADGQVFGQQEVGDHILQALTSGPSPVHSPGLLDLARGWHPFSEDGLWFVLAGATTRIEPVDPAALALGTEARLVTQGEVTRHNLTDWDSPRASASSEAEGSAAAK